MIVAVVRERVPGERRVALVPDAVKTLVAKKFVVRVEAGAGAEAGFSDEEFERAGAERVPSSEALLEGADVLLRLQPPSDADVELLREGQTVIGLLKPLDRPKAAAALARRRVTALALELVPRITRAQSMDVLSSQATIARYPAVLSERRHAEILSDAHDRGGHRHARARLRDRRRRRGPAGDRDRAPARCGGRGLRHAAGGEGRSKVWGASSSWTFDTKDGGRRRLRRRRTRRSMRDRGSARRADAWHDVVITTALVPGRRAPLLIDERQCAHGVGDRRPAAENGGNCSDARRRGRRARRHGARRASWQRASHARESAVRAQRHHLPSRILEGRRAGDDWKTRSRRDPRHVRRRAGNAGSPRASPRRAERNEFRHLAADLRLLAGHVHCFDVIRNVRACCTRR